MADRLPVRGLHSSPAQGESEDAVKVDDYIRAFIALAVVGVFCYLALWTEGYKEALIALVSGVAGYYIGSSSGSRNKDALLHKETE